MAARTLAQKIFGGKPVDPKEQAKQWRLKIKGEMRQLQRQIDTIDREEKKILKEIKKLAKEGQMDAVRTLAHAVSDSRKGKHRILMAKTGLNSMEMQIGQQMAMMRVGQALEKSSEIMAIMNKAVKLDAIGQTMRELAKEMETAGIIDELVDEAFADMDDEDAEDPVPELTKAHFEEAMQMARKSVGDVEIRRYEAFNSQMKNAGPGAYFKFPSAGEGEEGGAGGDSFGDAGNDDGLYD